MLKYKIVKNKISAPYKEATVPLIYGQGIDKSDELFQLALKGKIIKQGGAWYSCVNEDGEVLIVGGEEIKTQGKDKMIELIRNNITLFGYLEDSVRGIEVEADEMSQEEIEEIKNAEAEAGSVRKSKSVQKDSDSQFELDLKEEV